MIKAEREGMGPVLQSRLLQQLPAIDHFCSMRAALDPGRGVWMPRQVHGENIAVLADETPFDDGMELQPIDADAVITNVRGRWIGVRTADCVPVLLYDECRQVVAAIHAGWRGTVKHIVRQTLSRMTALYGTCPADVYAAIGPSISPEVFEVGEEVAQEFVRSMRGECVLREMWTERGKQHFAKPHIDLWQSNVMDLLELGVELDHIDCTPMCTFSQNDQLFSARHDGIETGRMVSAIQILAVKND